MRMQPVEGGRQPLVGRGPGRQIAGELLREEPVVREVLAEGPQHPVAIGPDEAFVVPLVAVAVRVAGRVEPVGGEAFGTGVAVQQPIDRRRPGRRGVVVLRGEEPVQLLRRGRQPGQIERDPPQPRPRRRRRRRREPPVRLLRRDEPVDRRGRKRGKRQGERGTGGTGRHACRFLAFLFPLTPFLCRPPGDASRYGHVARQRGEGPMHVKRGALFDPAVERVPLGLGQRAVRIDRRHPRVVGRVDAGVQFAARRCPRHDAEVPAEVRQSVLAGVQAELRRLIRGVGPMTGEAPVRQDRPHVPVEGDGPIGRGLVGRGGFPGPRRDRHGRTEESEEQAIRHTRPEWEEQPSAPRRHPPIIPSRLSAPPSLIQRIAQERTRTSTGFNPH